MIERIEVYKGVVPIYLGADALGGAVNIVTSDNAKDFLDVSYSYGSFNTHQAAVASRKTFNDKFVLNISGFHNYSDNNFPVDAQLVDKNTGKISEPKPFRLFNEQYRSTSAVVEGGVVGTSWADRLLVGLIASENKKHRQRGRAGHGEHVVGRGRPSDHRAAGVVSQPFCRRYACRRGASPGAAGCASLAASGAAISEGVGGVRLHGSLVGLPRLIGRAR